MHPGNIRANLDRIRERGRTSAPQVGDVFQRAKPVLRGPEFDRIMSIPRIKPYTDAQRDQMRDIVTKRGAGMRLHDVQCDALLSALEGPGGLVAPLGVGVGKTLIACLLPTILDAKAVVLAPPSLCKQGVDLCAQYRRHFHIRADLEWVPYSVLSSKTHADILHKHAPKVLICDEAHYLRHKTSARTKRWLRYLKAHPDTWVAVLSGTLTARSLTDFAHLLYAAQKDYVVLPRDYPTLQEWAESLDVGGARLPGALSYFCAPGESPRQGWFRRLHETPGVVASPAESTLGATLVLSAARPPSCPHIRRAIRTLTDRCCLPCGQEVDVAAHYAAVLRQLRCGGYYQEVWPPGYDPGPYKRARSAWCAWVREHIRAPLDTPGQVYDAVRNGSIPAPPELTEWERYHSDAPGRRWVWVSDAVVAHVRGLVRGKPTIVWTDVVEVGRKVAKTLGVPYYGAGDDPVTDVAHTCVMSIQAHGVGRNLQSWANAVVMGGTPNASRWEQLLGRLHRQGQTADEVRVSFLWPEEVTEAHAGAQYIQDMTGTRQKILYATWEDK